MAHQLYVLQVLTFNLLEDRMMTKMDPQDQVSAHCPAAKAHGGENVSWATPKPGDFSKDTIDLLPSQNLGEWI